MPLFKKTKYPRVTKLTNYQNDEQIYYCSSTNEIFRDYDDYCNWVLICNSMVWTCCYTGKAGLTYSEALESEHHAKQMFKDFPTDLRVPVIFIASKTCRISFNEMVEDVYGYVKDRYFIGENVQASFSGNKWHDSHVLQVIAPTQENLKKSPRNGQSQYGPTSTMYHYEVEQMDSEDPDLSEVMIVKYDQIRRKKRFGRDKLKMFLKQHVELNKQGVFAIKPSVLEKFGIYKTRFSQIFDGNVPSFEISKKLKKIQNAKQGSLVPFLKKKGDSNVNSKPTANGLSENSLNLIEKMKKRHEDFQQKKEDLKQKRAEQRSRLRQENMKISNMLRDWNKPKRDLELEDHKVLPVPIPVCTQIPDEHMGEVFTILEFVHTFSKFLSCNSYFPGGLTLEILERAFVQKEVAGPLMDLIQMLLTAIFSVQHDEASQYNTKLDVHSGIKGIDYNDDISLTKATHFATLASNWSSTYQGIGLINLPLYTLTTSEILRLHLLSSGARINDTGSRWRYQYRGGYTSEDDPGLHFRLKQPHILKALAIQCVTELPLAYILKIIDCLISQLLTYADIRNVIEDHLEQSRQAKQDYKAAQTSERKIDQEYITARVKIKKEARENKVDPKEQLDKLSKETEHKKGEIEVKVKRLKKLSNKHLTHLGQDRAYRKFIKLVSLPGLVINFEEHNPGYCYEECIPQNPSLVNAGRTQILEHLQKKLNEPNTSNKENIDDDIQPNKQTSDMEPKDNANSEINTPAVTADTLLICNSNPTTCLVHSTASKDRWSFYNTSEQITELVESLNARGIQESELKQTILNDEQHIVELVVKTPHDVLQSNSKNIVENENEESRSSRSKKLRYEDTTLGYSKDLSTALILQYALTDNILDIEEKLFTGNLGTLKIQDRETWRNFLTCHQFDLFNQTYNVEKPDHTSKNSSRSASPDLSNTYHDPGIFLGSRDTHNDEQPDPEQVLNLDEHKLAIQSLTFALLQVAEGVDNRYLKKPLGNIGPRNDANKISQVIDKWKLSLMACTSYCQIFLHYNSLDNCILWTRSALNARCTVCRKQRDSENMLVCENCNRGQHLYCHKPKLKSIPEGDWFCNTCRKLKEAEEKLKNTPKVQNRRRIFEDVETPVQSDSEDIPISNRVQRLRKLDDESSEQSEHDVDQQSFRKRTRHAKQRSEDTSEQCNANSNRKRKATTRHVQNHTEQSDDDDDDNDEQPLAKQMRRKSKRRAQLSDSETDDLPLSKQLSKLKKVRKLSTEESSEQSDSIILNGRKKVVKQKRAPIISDESSEHSDIEENGNEQNGLMENSEQEESEGEEVAEEEDAVEEDKVEGEDVNETELAEGKEDINESKNTQLHNGDALQNGDSQAIEVCEKCGTEGTLLCCDNCPELYHLECANPPLRRVPRGEWFCHKCKSAKKNEDSDDDWSLSHSVAQRSGVSQNQRRCAARGRNSVYGFAKILRRISKYEDNTRRSSIRRDDLPLNNAQLQELLTDVMKQEYSWPFLRPVNKHEVPDYYDIIENPMDFGTIKYKLNMGTYRFDAELMADVSLVFENCKIYNSADDEVFQCGLKVLQCFVEKCHELGLRVPQAIENREVLVEEVQEDPLNFV